MKTLITFYTTLILSLGFTAAPVQADSEIKAPQFHLNRVDNTGSVRLSDYRGKVIYLDFWASWCTPCRKSLPLLNELRNELHGKGFEVLAINLDESKEEALAFLEEIPVDYPTLYDDADTAAAYELRGMPTAYLIDTEGKLHSQHVGFHPRDMPEIRDEVLKLLKASR